MFLSETQNEHLKNLMLDALGDFHGAKATYSESEGYVGMRLEFPGDLYFYKSFPVEWAVKHPQALADLYVVLATEAWENSQPDNLPEGVR